MTTETAAARRQKVVVTGAGGVMGRQIVRTLSDIGYTVLGIDRESLTLDNGAQILASDVTDPASIRPVFEAFAGEEGLYGLVNCAAIIPTAGLWDIDAERFLKTIEVNTWGTFNASREASKLMGKNGASGRIVNVASVAGYIGGLVGGPDYAASKAGVIVLSKVLARELSSLGITVNTVAPGALVSRATDVLDDEVRDTLLSKIPAGRLGEMKEIVHSIAHLLSDGASYTTGSTLDVNGGVYLR